MYFVRDASGETNLVIHVGAPNAESMARGECKLFIEAEVAANRGVVPLQFDGIGARNASDGSWYGTCANASQDCHSWDTAIGKGYFQWSGVRLLHPQTFLSLFLPPPSHTHTRMHTFLDQFHALRPISHAPDTTSNIDTHSTTDEGHDLTLSTREHCRERSRQTVWCWVRFPQTRHTLYTFSRS